MANTDSKFWNSYFRSYDILNTFIPYSSMMKTVSESIEVTPEDTILDLGCGTGNLLPWLPVDSTVITVDFSEHALGIAGEKSRPVNCSFATINLENSLPFGAHIFTKMVSINVLYAFSCKRQHDILKEIKRILVPGGKAVIVLPRPGASRFGVFRSHLKQMLTQKGYISTAAYIIRTLTTLSKMNRYNRIIERNASNSNYCFRDKSTFRTILSSFGFYDISVTGVYAGQAYLYSFRV